MNRRTAESEVCEEYDSKNILRNTNYWNTIIRQFMMEENRRVQYIFLLFTQKETA